MIRKRTQAVLFLAALAVTAGWSFGQVHVEVSAFGGYGLNLSFPNTMTIDSTFQGKLTTYGYYNEWKTLLTTPVLEQKGGAGFGGRVLVQITPLLGLEAGVEYGLNKFALNAAAMSALNAKMTSINYAQYCDFLDTGGHVLRISGNLLLNLVGEGAFIPYVTLGAGTTSYTVEPALLISRPAYSETLDLHYANASALTFNGGAGFKYFLTPSIGLRFDARVYYSSPKFEQSFYNSYFGITPITQGYWTSQSGTLLDASLNVGLFIRII